MYVRHAVAGALQRGFPVLRLLKNIFGRNTLALTVSGCVLVLRHMDIISVSVDVDSVIYGPLVSAENRRH